MHGIVHPQFMCAGNRTLFECLSEIYVFEPSTAPQCLLVINKCKCASCMNEWCNCAVHWAKRMRALT
jgi:hypothetical protein